ncbi:MAG TPA: hypothetical protein PK014_09845 [Thermoanaerobaculia bacterium]|nr:hypothetical protein [Thermoanaerobaculia bacterium]HUM30126.1 hypothetical protein [Thermoanaerobaculia bacterium]HXK68823.1 hypothetical protein [Thermoanaerobaculia bacterium]
MFLAHIRCYLHSLLLSFLFFSGFTIPCHAQDIVLEEETGQNALNELRLALKLSDEQTHRCSELLKVVEAQARLDRQNYRGDFDSLVMAYDKRMAFMDQNLISILTEPQRPLYEAWIQNRTDQHELLALREGLDLAASQKEAIAEIQDRFRQRAEKERGEQRTRALDLIQAAERREEERVTAIETLLNKQQKNAFKKYLDGRIEDPIENEMFRLREGLLLTAEQERVVRKILAHYGTYEPGEQRRPRGSGEGRPPEGMGRRHSKSGETDMDGPPPHRGASPGDEEIRKLLDEQQKVLFDQLLQERMENMRNRRPKGPGMGEERQGRPGRPPGGGF